MLFFLAKAFGAYLIVGLMFWLLFRKEIGIKKNLTVYNFLMRDKNKFHYVYRAGGRTVSILLGFYIVPYLYSMRRLVLNVHKEDRVQDFIDQSEEFILNNKDSSYLVAIDKRKIT